VRDVKHNMDEISKSFRRPDDLVAAVRNIESYGAQLHQELVSGIGIDDAAGEKLARNHKEFNQLAVATLRANDVDVVRIADHETIDTADGPTRYGDIVYMDEEGKKRKITESFIQGMLKSKGELLVGGITGVAGGIAAGAAAGAAGMNPATVALFAIFGGISAGAAGVAAGRGMDMLANAWDTKTKLDGLMVAKSMVDAGIWDAAYATGLGATGGIIKSGLALGKGVVKGDVTLSQIYKGYIERSKRPEQGVKSIQEILKESRKELSDRVRAHNKVSDVQLDPEDARNIIKVVSMTEPRLYNYTEAAISKSESSGAGMQKMLKKQSSELRRTVKSGTNRALPNEWKNQLTTHSKYTSNFFGKMEDVGSDIVREAEEAGMEKFTLNFETDLGPLVNKLDEISNLDNEPAVKILESRIKEVRTLATRKSVAEAKEVGAGKVAEKKAILTNQKKARKEVLSDGTVAIKREAKDLAEQVDPINKRIANKEQDILDLDNEIALNPEGVAGLKADRSAMARDLRQDKLDLKELVQSKKLPAAKGALESVKSKNIMARMTEKLKGDVLEEEHDVVKAVAKALETSDNGFKDLLALRKAVGRLNRDSGLASEHDVSKALKSYDTHLGKKIDEVADTYMGKDAPEWKKNYRESRREYAGLVELKKNPMYRAIVNADANTSGYERMIQEGFESMTKANQAYNEVASKLSKPQQRAFEKALINTVLDRKVLNEGAEETAEGALNIVGEGVNWTEVSNGLRHLKLRTKDGIALRQVADKYAATFGDMTKLGRMLEKAKSVGDSTGIGTSMYSKTAQLLINTSFKATRSRVGFTAKNRAMALVDTISDILDNPYNAKAIHKAVREMKDVIPEKDLRSLVSRVQDGDREYGSLKDFKANTKVYYRTKDGSISKEGNNRVVGATEADAPGVGRLKTAEIDGATVKTVRELRQIEDIQEFLGRDMKVSDLNNEVLLDKLAENTINAVEIGNKTYPLEHWNP